MCFCVHWFIGEISTSGTPYKKPGKYDSSEPAGQQTGLFSPELGPVAVERRPPLWPSAPHSSFLLSSCRSQTFRAPHFQVLTQKTLFNHFLFIIFLTVIDIPDCKTTTCGVETQPAQMLLVFLDLFLQVPFPDATAMEALQQTLQVWHFPPSMQHLCQNTQIKTAVL